ncbi:hypothetical protein AVEN_34738-1 [Araneus ventricosus]|uniref:Ig-like domain-containing protein n=1 Tax=Araneus ventricosus TaxID=182803 RepID=A0A4Y2GU56_ARAVE|nr:hypothetical protein AVEN_34738-1 [Araneus ventricosus]
MLIFLLVPANEFELSYTELSDASVNVTCEAQGLFPPPVLKLYLGSSTGSPLQTVTDAVSVVKPKYSGAYDAFLYRTFSASELSKNGASVFECFLELPGTNYARAKRIAYYPGKCWNNNNLPIQTNMWPLNFPFVIFKGHVTI